MTTQSRALTFRLPGAGWSTRSLSSPFRTRRTAIGAWRSHSLFSFSTGLAQADAQADFARARRAFRLARLAAWLTPSRRESRRLTQTDCAEAPAGLSRIELVPLRCIVGALEPTRQFDDRFRPASDAVRSRWERIALARRRGIPLPPIVVDKRRDGYYVVDGRHRVSVAGALGQTEIEAWITDRNSISELPSGNPVGHIRQR